jgi:hypothetical protein
VGVFLVGSAHVVGGAYPINHLRADGHEPFKTSTLRWVVASIQHLDIEPQTTSPACPVTTPAGRFSRVQVRPPSVDRMTLPPKVGSRGSPPVETQSAALGQDTLASIPTPAGAGWGDHTDPPSIVDQITPP